MRIYADQKSVEKAVADGLRTWPEGATSMKVLGVRDGVVYAIIIQVIGDLRKYEFMGKKDE